MLLKAGTYTFIETPTELESGQSFEQNINLTFTETDEDITGTFYVSKISAVKVDYFALYYTAYSAIIEGEEQLSEELIVPIYSTDGRGWVVSRTHTITEDVKVSNKFGTWYIANTDYIEVSGETPELDPEEPEEPEPTKIAFYINRNGVIYHYGAKEGRTWREWVGSGDDYNGDQHFIIVSSAPDYIAFKLGNNTRLDVDVDNVIEDGKTYYTIIDEPETPTKKFTRLYIGETAYSSNGKRFRKLQDTEYVEEEEPPIEEPPIDEPPIEEPPIDEPSIDELHNAVGTWQVNEEFPSGISAQDFAIEGNFYVVNSNVPQFETVPLAEFEWRNNSLYLISDIELTHDTYNVYYMSFSGTPSIFTQWGESEFIGIAKTNVNAPTLRTFQITGGKDVEKEEFLTLLKSVATKIS